MRIDIIVILPTGEVQRFVREMDPRTREITVRLADSSGFTMTPAEQAAYEAGLRDGERARL